MYEVTRKIRFRYKTNGVVVLNWTKYVAQVCILQIEILVVDQTSITHGQKTLSSILVLFVIIYMFVGVILMSIKGYTFRGRNA